MTDQDLQSIIEKFSTCVTLNATPLFVDEEARQQVSERAMNIIDYTLAQNFRNAIIGVSNTIRNTNSFLLGPIFRAHQIKIIGLMLIADELDSGSALLEAYGLAKKNYYQAGAAVSNLDFEKQMYITTVYANTIATDLNLPGFKHIENKALDLCFKTARENSLYDIDEDFIKSDFYINKDETEVIRIVNYYDSQAPRRSSDFQFIQGNKFSSPESHIFLAVLPSISSTLKQELSAEELELFKILANPFTMNSLATKNKLKAVFNLDIYQSIISEIELQRFKEFYKQMTLTRLDNRIDDNRRTIEGHIQEIQRLEDLLDKLLKEQFYIQYTSNESDEQIEYIFKHPYLRNVTTKYNEVIAANTRTPLSMFDPEIASNIIRNMNNIFERNNVEERYQPYIRFFFDVVFTQQQVVYYMQNHIEFNLEGSYTYRNLHYSVNSDNHIELMRTTKAGYNPHIEHYNCQGTHKVEINKAIKSKNLIAIIEALLNPLKNWNLADGAVMNSALQYMFPILIDHNIPCLEYENEMYSIRDLFDKLHPVEERVPVEENVEVEVEVEEDEEDE